MRSSIHSWVGLWQRLGFRALRNSWKPRRKGRRHDALAWTRHRCGFEGLEARRMLAAFSVSDVTVTEGGAAQFTVSYTGSLTGMATLTYGTANNTATTGDFDYTAANGSLMFMQGGPTSQTVSVNTGNDSKDEDDETFYLNLSNPSNCTITDSQGVGTITDNDAPPTLSINNANSLEGAAATFTATLSAASAKTITVDYATCPTCQKPCRDCGLNEWSYGLPPTCKGGSHERGRTSPVGRRVSIGSGALGWRVAG
jgi:hypothetical protein